MAMAPRITIHFSTPPIFQPSNLSPPPVMIMSAINQCCTFYVNGLYFGINVLQVREIVRYQKMTHVPMSHEVIQGLINLRGEIVTAIDLRMLLEGDSSGQNKEPMNIVVMSDGSPVSLLVDEVGDVINVDITRMEEPPDTLDSATQKLVENVYKMDDRLMHILNVEEAVSVRSGR